MKKKFLLFISALLLLFALFPLQTVFAAELSDNIVLQLTETHTNDEIVINVNLVTNTGISAMTLELVYDQGAFAFAGYEKGTALGQLDLISTNLAADPTLPVKFNWFNQGTDVENDFSTGRLLQLRFSLKPNAAPGEYSIGFRYDPQSDIVYIDRGNPATKIAAIGKAVLSVSENKIAETEIVDADPSEDGANVFWLICAIVSIAAVLCGTVIAVVIIIMKKKRKKKNWLKL